MGAGGRARVREAAIASACQHLESRMPGPSARSVSTCIPMRAAEAAGIVKSSTGSPIFAICRRGPVISRVCPEPRSCMSLTLSIPNGGATHGRSTIRRIGEVAGGGAQPAADAQGHVGAGWSGGRDRGGTARRCSGSAPGIRRAAAAGRMCAYLRWDDVRREWLRGDMRVPPRTRLHRGNGTLRVALLWQRSVQRGLPLRSGEQCLRIQSSWRCVQRG